MLPQEDMKEYVTIYGFKVVGLLILKVVQLRPTPAASSTFQNNCVIREHLDQGVPKDLFEAKPQLLGVTWGLWIADPWSWISEKQDKRMRETGNMVGQGRKMK